MAIADMIGSPMAVDESGTRVIEPTENVVRVQPSRFGLTPLQQFARGGLDLKITDFRNLCEALNECGLKGTPHEIGDVLFIWMTNMLDD